MPIQQIDTLPNRYYYGMRVHIRDATMMTEALPRINNRTSLYWLQIAAIDRQIADLDVLIAGLYTKFLNGDSSVASRLTNLQIERQALINDKEPLLAMISEITTEEMPTPYVVQDITRTLTVELQDGYRFLNTAKAVFFDPQGELFGAIKKGDHVSISMGWEGVEDPWIKRYQVQPVFEGFVALKRGLYTGKDVHKTEVYIHDRRMLLHQERCWESLGESIHDDTAFEFALKNIGLDSSFEGGQMKKHKIVANKSLLEYFSDCCKANSQRMLYVMREDGLAQLKVMPDSERIRDDSEQYHRNFKWGVDILEAQLIDEWTQPTWDNQTVLPVNTDIGQPNEYPYVQPNHDSYHDSELGLRGKTNWIPPVGVDDNDTRTLSGRVQFENPLLDTVGKSDQFHMRIKLKGEPNLSLDKCIKIQNWTSDKEGYYYINSIKHTIDKKQGILYTKDIPNTGFYTWLDLTYIGEQKVLNLQEVVDAHIKILKEGGDALVKKMFPGSTEVVNTTEITEDPPVIGPPVKDWNTNPVDVT